MEDDAMSWDRAVEAYKRRAIAHSLTSAHVTATLKHVAELRLACPPELSDLRSRHVRDYLYEYAARLKKEDCKGWARTCNKVRAYLRGFFSVALREDFVEFNPVDKSERFREPVLVPRNVSPAEFRAVCEKASPELAEFLRFLVRTGCRFSEAAGMEYGDIREGVWHIKRRKRDVQHTVPIAFSLPTGEKGRVWRPWGAAGRLKNGGTNRRIAAACAAAGVPAFTCHDLRHAAATWAEDAGVGLDDRRKLLGHTSARMTGHYSHGNTTDGAARAQAAIERALA